jgi:hypothetical protein
MDNVFAKDVVIQDQLTKFADFIASYMDDTFIFSDTIEEHIYHIIVSLTRLWQFGLYVKPSKCEWLQTAILFLGHQITSQGRTVDPIKVNALQSWPVPTNRSELRSLLGTFGYWHIYIKNYASIVSCMTSATDRPRSHDNQRHTRNSVRTAVSRSPGFPCPPFNSRCPHLSDSPRKLPSPCRPHTLNSRGRSGSSCNPTRALSGNHILSAPAS